jgi:cytochrome P450
MKDLASPTMTGGCPFRPTMPKDGTPFRPSPSFAQWRAEAPATQLLAEDGNVGWFVTGYELARKVLEDPRFSATRQRHPLGHGFHDIFEAHDDDDAAGAAETHDGPVPDVDPIVMEALAAISVGNVLSIDPPQHTRIRRSVMSRFSVRSVRSQIPPIAEFITQRLDEILARPTADLFTDFALPVSVFAHCQALGIPDSHRERFAELFAGDDVRFTEAFDFVREVVELKRDRLGEDTISDLLQSELTLDEIRGITFILMGSGRDAIAFMISTNTASLLMNPEQLEILRADPALIPAAVEEFVRFNAMFVSTHPRTVAEDLTLDGIEFREGESVWISTVAGNRDPDRFPDPDTFDVTRDAFGHIAFGHGIHACIGQQLARAVIAEAITQLLSRAPGLRLLESQQAGGMEFAGPLPTYAPGRVVVGW